MAETFKVKTGTPEQNEAARQAYKDREYKRLKLAEYNLGRYTDSPIGDSLLNFLNDSTIPQQRKDALLAEIHGKLTNLPQQTDLDKFSEMVIGRSNYTRDMHNIDEAVGALIGQYQNTDYEESYNSAQANILREGDAGINPDIVGTDQGGEASNFDDQASDLQTPLSDSASAASDFASKGFSIIQALFGLGGQIQNFIARGAEIKSINLSNDRSLQDIVKGSIATTYSTKQFQDSFAAWKKVNDDYLAEHGENDERAHNWKIATEEEKLSRYLAQSVVKDMNFEHLSPSVRKQAKAFARTISEDSDFMMSLRQGTASQLAHGRASELQDNATIAAFSKGFADFYSSALAKEQEYLSNYYDYMAQLASKYAGTKIKYEKDGKFYKDGQEISFADLQFDEESSSLLENYMNTLNQRLVTDLQAQSNSIIQSLITGFTDPSKKHDFFEQCAVFLLPHLVNFFQSFGSQFSTNFGNNLATKAVFGKPKKK